MLVVKKMRRTQQRAMRRKSQRIGGKTRHLGSQKMKVAQGKELSTMENVAKILRTITTEKWLLDLITSIGDLDTRNLIREKKRKKLETGAYNTLSKCFTLEGGQK